MKTYFLKFADEAEAISMMAAFRIDAKWQTSSPDYALDVIGLIYKPTGDMLDSDEGQYPEMAAIPGWHVNLAIEVVPLDLTPFLAFPSVPTRIFA